METMTETRTVIPFTNKAEPGVSPAHAAAVLRAVAAVASPDSGRATLAGVLVERENDGGSVTFTATDSYRLLSVTVPTNGIVAAFEPFILAAKDLAAVAKNVKKTTERFEIDYNAGDLVARFTIGGDILTVPTIGGTFADYKRLIPTEPVWPAAGEYANLNPVLLAGLLDSFALILAGGGSVKRDSVHAVTFSQVSPSKVAVLTAKQGSVTATGLIMPLRQ